MKQLLALALVVFLNAALKAQTTSPNPQPHFTFSIAGGPAIPISDFKSKDFNDANAGYARTGFLTEFSAGFRFNKFIGVSFAADFQENASASTTSTPAFPGAFDEGVSTTTRNRWNIGRLLIGPSFTLPLTANHKFALNVRALAGASKTKLPDYFVHFPPLPNALTIGNGDIAYFGPASWMFACQFDAGLQWHLTRHWYLSLDAGLAGSRQKETYSNAYYYGWLPPYVAATTLLQTWQTGKQTTTIATGTIFSNLGIGFGI